ncbi:hypothetical protein [Lacinutrix jangbogonensis]|uniref:hypothetical protein n=1 Tax=Lacinutrix jangbogonensis TaxID=1469557 RepID=UPI00053ED7B3|nr:hypothetical protein [Lacinutrix jangbogonensis]
MKKILLSSFLLNFIFQISFAQESVNDKAMSLINSDYFHAYKIEKFSLHTNKTLYFAGEKIWFKAYIAEDDTNTAFTECANIYLNLYDANFKLVLSNLFYAENGKSYGELELPDTLENGSYYLQLDTQWNKNFNRNSIFPIKIVDLSDMNSVNINQEILTETVDVSRLKANTESFEINRTDSNNKAALTFEIAPKTTIISNLDNSYGFAVLHREGSVRSMAPIKFNKDKEIYKINFAKNDVLEGLNTISVFNDKKEELYSKNFFIYDSNSINLNVIKDAVSEDSLTVNFNLFGTDKLANISVSVLPEETLVYKNKSNIISDYLIKPYLKGDHYNTAMRINNYKQEDFDAITQLEAKNNVFVYNTLSNRNTPYASEAGIILSGKVTTKKKNLSKYKVLLSSTENKITALTEIDNENRFKFEKLLLNHPTKYTLSLINEKGKIEKSNFFVYNTYIDYRANPSLNIDINIKEVLDKTDSLNRTVKNTENLRLPEFYGAEQLDEVNIEVYKAKKELELKRKIKNSGIFGLSSSRVVKPEDTGFNNTLFLTFLQTLPNTILTYTAAGIPQLVNTRGPKSINDAINPPIAVVWDGAILQDLSLLAFIYANEIDYVVLNINGTGYGSNFPYGVLHVVSKNGNDLEKRVIKNRNIKEFDTKFGFINPKEKYKLPDLAFSSQRTIDNFSTIDWVPNFNIKPNSDNLLKINRRDYDNIKLIINGITEDGKPFYKEHIINLSSN